MVTKEKLEPVLMEFNQWLHRTEDACLIEYSSHWVLRMALRDFPTFWKCYLDETPELQKDLEECCHDALEGIYDKKDTMSFFLREAFATLGSSGHEKTR